MAFFLSPGGMQRQATLLLSSTLSTLPGMRTRLFCLVLLLALPAALPSFAGQSGCQSGPPVMECLRNCGSAAFNDPMALRLAAEAEGVTPEAFRARLDQAAGIVADEARAVARAQGLDAASADRYVATRMNAFIVAEKRRLMDASPALRAHLNASSVQTMDTGAPQGLLVLLSALLVVAGAALRGLRRLTAPA